MADTAQGEVWKSLITHLTNEDPEQLLANPDNWRIHEVHQQEAMEAALREIGWAGAVIVNDQTGNVIDGHMRVSLALKRGETSIPVLHLNASEEQEKLILATFDPIGALAVADREKLRQLSGDVKSQEDALRTMLTDLSLRYRDGQVTEAFQSFLDNRESGQSGGEGGSGGESTATSRPATDDGFGDGEGGDEEQYFPVSYSLTSAQRQVVLDAIKECRANNDHVKTSADALVAICGYYLDDGEDDGEEGDGED